MIINNEILVTIRCLVYNHEPYLRQCLDGFVMQKTNFKFEAIVHDDASTDNSAAIIKEYAEKYPDVIKPIYETENQYSKRDGSLSRIINKAIAPSSKYIAYCEGDDYWTDPLKLQKQVDFLETHPDYSICSHDFLKFHQLTNSFPNHSYYYSLFDGKDYNQMEYIEYTLDIFFDRWWTQPLTYMYRNGEYLDRIPRQKYKYFRDTIFAYYILKEGKGALLNFIGGVYRVQENGIYSGKDMAYNWKIGVKNGYDIYVNEKDKRALKHCLRYELNRIYILKNNKRYKELAHDIFSFTKLMPLRISFQLFKQLIIDKVIYWKSLI